MRQTALRWIGLSGASLGLVAVTLLFTLAGPPGGLVSVPLHAAVEAFGAAIILMAAMLILLLAEDRPGHQHDRWVSAGLMATGCLDLFHACMPIGQVFVALHSLATCLGGVLIAGVWLPSPKGRGRAITGLPIATLVATGAVGTLLVAVPAVVPVMVSPDGGFRVIAMVLNALGGVGYLSAMVYFARSARSREWPLSGLCLLLGVSGLVFPISHLWSADWWAWHGFRLAGGLFAAGYLLYVYRELGLQTRDALRSRETFISMASHELRTPLMPLLLRLQVIQRDMQAGRAVTPLAIDKAVRNVQQVTALVNSLIASLEVGDDRLELHMAPVSLTGIVRDMAETYRLVSAKHQVVLDEPLVEVQVRGDGLRLGQVVANLLDNAITYSPGGPVLVAVREQDGMAAVTVSDHGIGIPATETTAVFDRFYRGGNFSPMQIPGLGLGLYISRGIVEEHGGRIEVTSVPGQGTAVTVWLPVLGATQADPPPSSGIKAA